MAELRIFVTNLQDMRHNIWEGFFSPVPPKPIFEPGDLVICEGELEAKRDQDGKMCTVDEIEADLGIKLPRLNQFYFVRTAHVVDGYTYVRLEELVNPILPGNTAELSFHSFMFRKVDSVHNKININEL